MLLVSECCGSGVCALQNVYMQDLKPKLKRRGLEEGFLHEGYTPTDGNTCLIKELEGETLSPCGNMVFTSASGGSYRNPSWKQRTDPDQKSHVLLLSSRAYGLHNCERHVSITHRSPSLRSLVTAAGIDLHSGFCHLLFWPYDVLVLRSIFYKCYLILKICMVSLVVLVSQFNNLSFREVKWSV